MDIDMMEDPRGEIKKAIADGDLQKLLTMSGTLHGHYCPGLAYGVRAAFRAVTDLGVHSTGMEEVVAIVESNNCFADGVQFVTGCSFANNALIFRDVGKTAVTLARRTGDGVRVVVNMDRESLARREPEAMALFQKLVVNREGDEEDRNRLMRLWRRASFNTLEVPDDELLKVQKITIELPAYAKIYGSVTCAVCGESVMELRIRMKNGQPVCLPCSGQEYYELTGNGICVVNAGG